MFYLRYLGSLLYDVFIIITLFFTFTAICLAMRSGQVISPHTLWYQLSLLLIGYSYYAGSHQFGGQTLGMRAWKIKLMGSQGYLSQKQILWRFGLFLPSIIWAFLRLKSPDAILNKWTSTEIIHHVCSQPLEYETDDNYLVEPQEDNHNQDRPDV
jgi:uncharacterized RDD family membrane protein YckC